MFNLEEAISRWRQRMTAAGLTKAELLEELESPLRDDLNQQMQAEALAGTSAVAQLLSRAGGMASPGSKAIFVQFSSPACGPCKRLGSFLERPDIKSALEKYFIDQG